MSRADSGRLHSDREELISRAFVSLADTLVDEYDVIDLLDRLVGYSVELLAADAAGIVLADARGGLRAVAASSEDAQLMELLQLQSDQGPCLDCVRSGSPVNVIDLTVPAAADRWPVFAAAVADSVAFRSVHALPLRLRGEAIGALNLFHRQPGPLPPVDLSLGQALADVATIGILSRTRRPTRGDRQRTTPGRVEQPGHHRASQRRAGPERRPEHGRRVRSPAPLRPQPQREARRSRPPGRRQGFRPHRDPRTRTSATPTAITTLLTSTPWTVGYRTRAALLTWRPQTPAASSSSRALGGLRCDLT